MKRRRRVVSVLTAALLAAFAALFSGCSLFYKLEETEYFTIGYRKHDAFIGACFWYGDRDNMVVEVPDEYEGRKITDLGGFFGRGVPCPFGVALVDEELDWRGDNFGDDEYETLVFTVRLGKNIDSLVYVSGKDYYGVTAENPDGTQTSDALYKVAYRFEVDSENKMFYADGGKLYYLKDGSLVDEFFYED